MAEKKYLMGVHLSSTPQLDQAVGLMKTIVASLESLTGLAEDLKKALFANEIVGDYHVVDAETGERVSKS